MAPRVLLATSLALVLLSGSNAFARPNGEPQICANCHYQKNGPDIGIEFSTMSPEPGQTVNMTFTMTGKDPGGLRTGLYVFTDEGAFSITEPDYMQLISPTKILHSQPKDLDPVTKQASYSLAWTAPTTPGTARFDIWSMTGNSNGTEMDDHHATRYVELAFGCDAITYYPDNDGDGFGDEKRPKLSCEPVPNMLTVGGDCDDNKADVNPDARETCNARDDNCNGQIDEGLECVILYACESGLDSPIFGEPRPGYARSPQECFATPGSGGSSGGDPTPGVAGATAGGDPPGSSSGTRREASSGGCSLTAVPAFGSLWLATLAGLALAFVRRRLGR